jgi:putative flippase GtrA
LPQLLRFAAVGGVGFAADAGMLLLLARGYSISPLPARIVSFIVAATVTFALNQRLTFGVREKFSLRRWARYVGATAVGALVNIGIYQGWVNWHSPTATNLLVGAAAGSLVGLTFNYTLSRAWVFRQPKPLAGQTGAVR